GLMGIIADSVLENGGEAIGVIPASLNEKELAHTGVTKLHIVDSMHERKALMASYADAFVALPGGAGTLEEIFEVWTWGQLGYHKKPVAFLEINGFYSNLFAFINHITNEGFINPIHKEMLIMEQDPNELLKRLKNYIPPRKKWE
ncbi:MAG: TIGR00730 family Rossman fold protein, partial [Campylobacteraceae bacterium]|nr:TIGR00730 family Rossman fold protein [Campylobacteraceae bacterium]